MQIYSIIGEKASYSPIFIRGIAFNDTMGLAFNF